MKTILTALLVAATSYAQPVNSPDVELDTPGRSIKLQQGEAAPFYGVLLDEHEDVFRARREVRLQVKLDEYAPMVILPKAAFAGIIGGVVVVVLGIVFGGLALAKKL